MLCMLRPCALTVATVRVRDGTSCRVFEHFANKRRRPYKATPGPQHTAIRLQIPVQASSGSGGASKHDGMSDWPCDLAALNSARNFVRDAARNGGKVVLAPDRDADGLCAGNVLCSVATLALTTTVQQLACTLHTVAHAPLSVRSNLCIRQRSKVQVVSTQKLIHSSAWNTNKYSCTVSTQGFHV